MQTLLWIALALLILAVGIAVFVHLKRQEKQTQLMVSLSTWGKNCQSIDPKKTVFVLITCNRRTTLEIAEEMLPTLNELFKNSYCPHRVRVGLVTREGAFDAQGALFPHGKSQREAYPYVSRFLHQVRVSGQETRTGPHPARCVGIKALYAGERYVLFLHSRSMLARNWDTSFIASHGDREKTVVSVLGQHTEGDAGVVCTTDMDLDGFPELGSRAFHSVPKAARESLFASPRALFGLAGELCQPNEELVAFPDLAEVRADLDAFVVTLALRMAQFRICAPMYSTAYVRPKENSEWRKKKKKKVTSRIAVHSVQAIVAVLMAEQRFATAVQASDEAMIPSVHATLLLPWVRPVLGSRVIPPSLLVLLKILQQRQEREEDGEDEDENAGRQEVYALLTERAQQSIKTEEYFSKRLEKIVIGTKKLYRELMRHWPLRPETPKWEAVVRHLVSLNQKTMKRFLALHTTGSTFAETMHYLGLDVRRCTMAGRTVLGFAPGEPSRTEVLELFGTEAAYNRERARWKF